MSSPETRSRSTDHPPSDVRTRGLEAAQPEDAPLFKRGHIPALDGLRGVAILLVLCVHFIRVTTVSPLPRPLVQFATAGWTGVDLFFVLSGFLITGILLDSKGAPSFFRTFYTRRVLRIFPLYYGYLAIVFLLVPHLFAIQSQRFADLRSAQWWYWLYLSNVRNSLQAGWATDGIVTTHFWSLAVEEQFYLFWPLMVFLFTRRRLTQICLGIVAFIPLLRLALRLLDVNVVAVYVLTGTRADALALGALLALVARSPSAARRLHVWLGPLAVVGLTGVMTMFWVRGTDQFDIVVGTLGYSLLALTSAGLVGLGALSGRGGAGRRWMESRVLRFFGKYSYSMYIFHLPIIGLLTLPAVAARTESLVGSGYANTILLLSLALGATVCASLTSWQLYEKRFLALKRLVPYGGA